ncbi:MAG TPA: DUF3426 domain-containing protein, partial [Methylophilaceae bacterium]|nr:DUF3426 domain-containing protein [Methylophilaceae bacterium]
MSMVTSCPQCLTAFRVTEHELDAKDGKVRCGKCQHVFNALSRLAKADPRSSKREATALQPPPPPKPFFTDTASLDSKLASPRTRFKFSRWLSALLVCLLILLALLQAVFYLRTPIAAQWPMLRPHLVAICAVVQCTVDLPQQAELLTIDDSDMLEDAEREGVVHLSATLVNNASFTQAYPLLEITLTDAYDRPVVRRAVSAGGYLPTGLQMQDGIAPGESV